MKRRFSYRFVLCLSLAMVAGSVVTAHAAIFAGFDDGATADEVDGYPGKAGDGWAAGWSTNAGTPTTSVTDSSPLNDGGNYLNATVPSGTRQVGLGRRMDRPNAVVDLNAEHVVSFDFRIDDITAYALDGYGGTGAAAIRIANADSINPNHTTHTWWLAAFNRPNSPIHSGEWHVRAFASVSTVGTGIVPAEGVTYTFTFHVFPEDSQYRFLLADSLGNSWDSDDPDDFGERLNFRGDTPLTRSGDFIFVDLQKPEDAVNADFTYSLDSLTVIPEPATALLLALGVVLLCRTRQRAD